MVPPAVVVAAATRSASDSILRCREEERFRLQSATNPRLHRFLISGLDLGIDARFSLFKPSCVHRLLISGPDLRIDERFSPETAQRLHRFLISCPDLRIDASFSLFKPSCVHRFLISGPDFRINARKPSRTAQRLHRFLISRPDLRISAAPSLLQLKTARLQRPSRQRPSASDSNFCCCKEEWFRLQWS